MEHRWGHRLSTNIPVRLRCMQSRDSGCRCLGCLESISASGALIRTELGIRPAPNVVVQTLAPALGLQGRELPAFIVRTSSGEISVEWTEFASTGVSAVMTETMLNSGGGDDERPMPTLGRVRFCALASAGHRCAAEFQSPPLRWRVMRAEAPRSPDCLPDDKSVGEIYEGERSLCSVHRTGVAVPQDFSAPPRYCITSRRVRAAT